MKSGRKEIVIQPKITKEGFIEEVLRLKGQFPIDRKAHRLEKAHYIFGQ